eukprot:GILI01018822.1.p1 GENE.GILI01018822.1~~GILI01018822.1.p1  ORF type:complete len:349 (+),score=17.42 GILI01018822.1:65-1111(+)
MAEELRHKIYSACAGSLITSLLVTPLDVVKTRLQAPQLATAHNVDPLTYCLCSVRTKPIPVHTAQRPGTVATFSNLVKNEGFLTLWSGLQPTLIMAVPATIVYYTCYDELKDRFEQKYSHTSWAGWGPLVSGTVSRTFAVTLVSPFELVRTRMQAQPSLSSRGLLAACQDIVKEAGVRGLWTGLGPTLLRDVPFSAVYWTGYEFVKQRLILRSSSLASSPSSSSCLSSPHLRVVPSLRDSFSISFVAGAISGMIAAALMTPFDVIKTRQQVSSQSSQLRCTIHPSIPHTHFSSSPSVPAIVRSVWQEQGWRGFTLGLSARVMKIAPACAIMISTYEFGKQLFRERSAA